MADLHEDDKVLREWDWQDLQHFVDLLSGDLKRIQEDIEDLLYDISNGKVSPEEAYDRLYEILGEVEAAQDTVGSDLQYFTSTALKPGSEFLVGDGTAASTEVTDQEKELTDKLVDGIK